MRAWGQKDLDAQRAHLWIQNVNHTWYNATRQIPIPALSGAVNIAGFVGGNRYSVQWWSPYETNSDQQILFTETLTAASDGSIKLTVSNLTSDLAVQIMPEGYIAPPQNLRIVP
jgi:hypothetical protein